MRSERVPFKNEKAWVEICQQLGALSIPTYTESLFQRGKLDKPSFEVTPIAPKEDLMRMAACDLLSKAIEAGSAILTVTKVIGSMPLARYVAAEIQYHKNRGAANKEGGGCSAVGFDDLESIRKGDVVLAVEDSFTTGRRVVLLSDYLEREGVTMLPQILAFANLTRVEEVGSRKAVSLVTV
jgi:orotate phosphoribosyltransferase